MLGASNKRSQLMPPVNRIVRKSAVQGVKTFGRDGEALKKGKNNDGVRLHFFSAF